MNEPTRYFIQYQDPRKWTPELQEHYVEETLTCEDAATLQQARTLAARRIRDFDTHVGIYERRNLEQDAPYGPWSFDEGYLEDGVASKAVAS